MSDEMKRPWPKAILNLTHRQREVLWLIYEEEGIHPDQIKNVHLRTSLINKRLVRVAEDGLLEMTTELRAEFDSVADAT